MPYLPGIHEPDQQAAALFGDKPGTVVFTEAIGSNPNDRSGGDYRWWSDRGFRVIVRLNNGYKPDGTIPAPSLYDSFSARCAVFVAASQGCHIWIIGNEPNHEQERPNGQLIRATDYARCFTLCRNAIKRVNSTHQVIIAAVAPWNPQSGDWLVYWRTMLQTIADDAIADDAGADGISIHGYTHGSDPSLITSDHREHSWLWHFRTYRDQLAAVPASMRHLPVDLTETNQGDDPWADTNSGWVQGAMREIDAWNRTPGNQTIRSVVLYRWPRHDQVYSFADKAGVQDDFREACKQSYVVPGVSVQTEPKQTYMPSVHGGSQVIVMPERNITPEFTWRVPDFTAHTETPGRKVYRLIKAEYVPDGARRFGPDHHILVDVLDANGKRAFGVPVNFYWGSGMEITPINKVNEPYGADYGMTSHGHSFGVWVGNFREASDDVFGMGLGTIEQPDWNHHVSYYLVFQEVTIPAVSQPAPNPEPTQPATVPMLVHPVQDPRYRIVTQPYGVNGDYYKRFAVDGVPLQGHNGIDFGTPVGTSILAVDEGTVVEVHDEGESGYGLYVKLRHSWGESLYAHLSRTFLQVVGESVRRGMEIALSGNTGNSTGPHLHFGLRVHPFNRRDGWGGFSDPAPYLINTSAPQPSQLTPGHKEIVKAVGLAALEFDVDPDLLLSQAWAESSFNPRAVSSDGAKGLMQIMPNTWAEWSPRIGAGDDPFDPSQNARVGARYLKEMLRLTGNNPYQALIAYGWGIGNWQSDLPRPDVWVAYANKIVHGRDLLKAVGA